MNRRFYVMVLWVFITLPFVLMVGCGTTNLKQSGQTTAQGATLPLTAIPVLLSNAKQQQGQQKHESLLRAAHSLLKHGEYDWARKVLTDLDDQPLTDQHFSRYILITAQVALATGNTELAERSLWHERLTDIIPSLDQDDIIDIRELRSTLQFDLGNYKDSINERVLLDRLLSDDRDQQDLNQDLIWNTLMQLPPEELALAAQHQQDRILTGWYQLAVVSKNNQRNLRQQLEAVNRWATTWTSHPASNRRPADLQLLKQLVEQQPQQVALILPLSGRLAGAGKAVRDGIMASHYHARISGDYAPTLRFYDSQSDKIAARYNQAVDEGAQLVIGPLDKQNIQELVSTTALRVPTLALNYIDTSAMQSDDDMAIEAESDIVTDTLPDIDAAEEDTLEAMVGETEQGLESNSSLLYQFGLAVEDEAESVARRAWRDGHRQALVLAPAGEWGSRSVARFSETWLDLGGRIISDTRFNDQRQYSTLIANALDINKSKERARQIGRILGQKLEFEPRRRIDIDFIFLVAHPPQAQQLKPTLAFHYARSIPVYSVSHVYNGIENAKANQDMNGIRFASLPWFFMQELPEKIAIKKTDGASNYQRLHALGVDAYHVYPRLKQLEQVNQARFYGATGSLSLNPERRIKREPIWAMFTRGKTVAMPKKIARTQDVDEQDLQEGNAVSTQ